MAWLTLLLFLPWFSVIGGLFWVFPRHPRTPRRRLVDAALLCLALVASIGAMQWGLHSGRGQAGGGPLWPQILAVLYGYGTFLGMVGMAMAVRRRCW